MTEEIEYTIFIRCSGLAKCHVRYGGGMYTMEDKIPSDGVVVKNARLAVAAELRRKKILKQPIAKYDPKTGKVYLLHSDGTREEVSETRRVRYSERKR